VTVRPNVNDGVSGVRGELLALVGPTASGKTEASIAIAQALGAEIVSVDSTLVYRGMDVGTAKPSPADRARVPHHLLDVTEPRAPFSVAEFQRRAFGALRDIQDRGRRALLVGASGLYFRAIVDGLSFPGTAPGTRRLLETEARALGGRPLHRRLSSLDPAAARHIQPSNVRRTVRALEVAAITGRPFSSFARDWSSYPRQAVRAAGIEVPTAVLHGRIDQRVQGMMPGLLAEARRLLERGWVPFLASPQVIGYAEAVACIEGVIGEEEAAQRIARRTKALARRQMAWFRRDPRIRWFRAGGEGAAGIVGDVLRYLRRTDGRDEGRTLIRTAVGMEA